MLIYRTFLGFVNVVVVSSSIPDSVVVVIVVVVFICFFFVFVIAVVDIKCVISILGSSLNFPRFTLVFFTSSLKY